MWQGGLQDEIYKRYVISVTVYSGNEIFKILITMVAILIETTSMLVIQTWNTLIQAILLLLIIIVTIEM